jgi:hypothetical protein
MKAQTERLLRRALETERRRLNELDAQRKATLDTIQQLQRVLGLSPTGSSDSLYEQVVAFIDDQGGETKIASIHEAFPGRSPKAIRKALSRAAAKRLVVRVKGKRGVYLPAGLAKQGSGRAIRRPLRE